ncbi:lipocalin family protein [Capnocytophaga sputigena]|uniref:lipocalin family protein n=1 Tax=Capnocytophaga sputigena TaxID=1019 RepID=UPI0028E890E5|nr:lipocalin family protein [Capnocytophaga sputigena]
MKNLLKMAFIAVAIFVTSCGKSDEQTNNQTNNNNNLVGSWIIESETENGIAKVLNECEKKNTYTFTTDNKYSLVSYDKNPTNNQCKENLEEGTYTITGKQIVLTEKGDRIGEADEATFSIANNKLTLTFEDFNESSSATKLLFISIRENNLCFYKS